MPTYQQLTPVAFYEFADGDERDSYAGIPWLAGADPSGERLRVFKGGNTNAFADIPLYRIDADDPSVNDRSTAFPPGLAEILRWDEEEEVWIRTAYQHFHGLRVGDGNNFFELGINDATDALFVDFGSGFVMTRDADGELVYGFSDVGGATEWRYDPGQSDLMLSYLGNVIFKRDGSSGLIEWPQAISHLFEDIALTFKERTTPSDPASNYGSFYAKDVGGVTLPHWKRGSTEKVFILDGASPTFDDLFVLDDLDVDGDVDIAGNVTFHGFQVGIFGVGLSAFAATATDVDFISAASEATNDNPTQTFRQGRVATTDATVTTINTIAVPTNTAMRVEVDVIARRTGGALGTAGDSAGYKLIGSYKNEAGTVTAIGAGSGFTTTLEDQAAWTVAFSISGTNLLVRVTGAGGNDITWHSHVTVWKVSS